MGPREARRRGSLRRRAAKNAPSLTRWGFDRCAVSERTLAAFGGASDRAWSGAFAAAVAAPLDNPVPDGGDLGGLQGPQAGVSPEAKGRIGNEIRRLELTEPWLRPRL